MRSLPAIHQVVSHLPQQADEGGRGVSIYSLLLKSRIVFLGFPIDDQVANLIIAQLLYLEQEDDEKDIRLYINSPGGAVEAGLAIYDTMQLLRPDVSTLCLGMAASFATVVLAAGAKGKRYALPNATVHMHQPMGAAQGQSVDVEIAAQRIVQVRQRLYGILNKHTGQPVEKITRDCDRDFFLTADQAVEYGIIDEVFTREKRSRMQR